MNIMMKRAFAGLLIVLTFVIAGAVTEIKTPHNVAPEECKKIPLKVDDTISQCEKIWFAHCILAVILVFGTIVVHNMRNTPDAIRNRPDNARSDLGQTLFFCFMTIGLAAFTYGIMGWYLPNTITHNTSVCKVMIYHLEDNKNPCQRTFTNEQRLRSAACVKNEDVMSECSRQLLNKVGNDFLGGIIVQIVMDFFYLVVSLFIFGYLNP